MRVLVIDCFDSIDPDAAVVAEAVRVIEAQGNIVDRLQLMTDEFADFMSPEERRAYETDEPLIAPETIASAELVKQADALLFCYPTTLFGVPPRLKSWLERVMVLGVAFVFDDNRRIKPGLHNVRRLGVITTSSHSVTRTLKARDLGRRTIMRTLRLNCHPRCLRTFVRLRSGSVASLTAKRISLRLRRWT